MSRFGLFCKVWGLVLFFSFFCVSLILFSAKSCNVRQGDKEGSAARGEREGSPAVSESGRAPPATPESESVETGKGAGAEATSMMRKEMGARTTARARARTARAKGARVTEDESAPEKSGAKTSV